MTLDSSKLAGVDTYQNSTSASPDGDNVEEDGVMMKQPSRPDETVTNQPKNPNREQRIASLSAALRRNSHITFSGILTVTIDDLHISLDNLSDFSDGGAHILKGEIRSAPSGSVQISGENMSAVKLNARSRP